MNNNKGHNKKRNVGLLYEFLVRTVSSSLVDDNSQRSTIALDILKKYFKSGTELYKEFRLLNSLMKVSVGNQGVASSIITEAKSAARSHDAHALEKEKSYLIKDINHKLADTNFWDQPIAEYKMYATVQTLINDWRLGPQASLDRLAEYEDRLVRWLTEPRNTPEVKEELGGTIGENRFLYRIMMKRLNDKYGCSLSSREKAILREYVFSVGDEKARTSILESLEVVKKDALTAISVYTKEVPGHEYMLKKVNEVRDAIVAEQLTNLDDGVVTRFMLYMKLISELESKEK